MQIRLAADLQPDSVVDGEGVRTVLWTQGCPHACKGCHNPQTHSFDGGALVDVDYIIEELRAIKNQDGKRVYLMNKAFSSENAVKN